MESTTAIEEIIINGRRYRLVPLDAPHRGEKLTIREFEIVTLVARGLVNKQIADVLSIRPCTVSTHIRKIFSKCKVDTRAAMVHHCMRSHPQAFSRSPEVVR